MVALQKFKMNSGMTELEWKSFCRRYKGRNVSVLVDIIRSRIDSNANEKTIQKEIDEECEKLF